MCIRDSFSTFLTLAFGFLLTKIGYANIWPRFGSANQLLSALVLATLCVFLKVTGRSNKKMCIRDRPRAWSTLITAPSARWASSSRSTPRPTSSPRTTSSSPSSRRPPRDVYKRQAYNYVKEVAAEGGDILFVGTKKQAQESIRDEEMCIRDRPASVTCRRSR